MPPALAARVAALDCLRYGRLQSRGPTSYPFLLRSGLVPRDKWNSYSNFRIVHRSSKEKGQGVKHVAQEAHEAAKSRTDPYDCSVLEATIARVQTELKEKLSRLRGGGKFNTEAVENLRVKLDKSSKDAVQLGELAQCVPRGRVLQLMAGEKDHVKPITSAVQSSGLSLNPQPDPHNPLQLNIQLPPTTAESRKAAVDEAVKLANTANSNIKNARATQQKRLRGMPKQVRPDDIRKATEKMEKIVSDATSAAKTTLNNAKKILESA